MTQRIAGRIAQLRERRILRTAVLYIGGAWIVAQVGDFAIQNYEVDRRYLDVVLYLLTVGLPAAIVIAWYHGPKGQQRIKRAEVGVLALLGVVAVVGSGLLLGRERSGARRVSFLPAATMDLGDGSVAILPLSNNTGADSLDWLSTGLADMLTTNLAQIPAVRVVSVERLLDLMRQAGREESDRIPEDLALNIASSSGARLLMRGSIAGGGTRIRMDVRLIDLQDGTIIAAEHATGDDVYALVDDVSRRLSPHLAAGAVEPTELTPVAQLATGSLDAFKEYREGIRAERRFLFEPAEEHYRQAVALDSTFAVAWFRLGLNLFQQGNVADASQAMGKAARFIEGTSERDRLMIEALTAFVRFDPETADARLNELIAKYPDDKEARTWLAVLYAQTDRQDERRSVLEEILRLDPFYAPVYNELAYMAARRGDTIAADTLSLRYLDLEPGQPNPFDSRGEILELTGRTGEARDAFRQAVAVDPGFVIGYQHLIRSYLRAEDVAGARTELASHLGTEDPDASVWVSLLSADTYVAQGDYLDGLDGYGLAAHRASELGRDDLRLIALLDAGNLASALGDEGATLSSFDEARTIDPYSQEAFFGTLRAMGRRGQVERMRSIRDAVAENLEQIPEGFRQFARQSLVHTDALTAYYRGDLDESVRLMKETLTGFRVRYVFPEGVEALINVGEADEARTLARRMSGAQALRSGERVLPLRQQQRIYWMARADEASGDTAAAIAGYERLGRIAGAGLELLRSLRDTRDRLAHLRENEDS